MDGDRQPVFPLGIAHRVTRDDVYGNYFIPKGILIIGNAWYIILTLIRQNTGSDTIAGLDSGICSTTKRHMAWKLTNSSLNAFSYLVSEIQPLHLDLAGGMSFDLLGSRPDGNQVLKSAVDSVPVDIWLITPSFRPSQLSSKCLTSPLPLTATGRRYLSNPYSLLDSCRTFVLLSQTPNFYCVYDCRHPESFACAIRPRPDAAERLLDRIDE